MNFGSTAIKLNSVKSYNVKANNANNVFKNKFYSDSKIDSDNYYKYEDIDYNKINLEESIEKAKSLDQEEWYESAFNVLKTIRDYGVTFQTSLTFGALELVENVGDALIMAGGAIASGVVSIWDEDKALEIKESTGNVVAYDWTEALYDEAIKFQGVDQDIAHSWVHTAGSMVGTTAAYIALSCVPGGAVVTATVGAVTAAGSASEMALSSGANFDQAFTCGTVAGVIGAASGGALKEVQVAAKGATSLAGVVGYTLAGAGVSAAEPVLNSGIQYITYGEDVVDENGNPLYNGFWDYYKKSGALLQTAMAGTIGGVSTGYNGIKGYNNYKKVYDNINNMENLDAKSIQELQRRFESLSSKQVYSVVENSDNKYFKSNLKTYDLITSKNAAEFIKFEGYNSEYKTANFNLKWPDHAGYDPETIGSLKTLIDSYPDGKIKVSRVGGDGGHALGTDWESTSSQRSLPSSSSNGTAGIFDGNKYIEAIDVCSGTVDDISKVRRLVNLGYSEEVAEAMIRDFNSFDSLPEIGGNGGLNEVLKPNQQSKYGYSGKAASWATLSVKMDGEAGQMNSIFSFGTLKRARIITDLRSITF